MFRVPVYDPLRCSTLLNRGAYQLRELEEPPLLQSKKGNTAQLAKNHSGML